MKNWSTTLKDGRNWVRNSKETQQNTQSPTIKEVWALLFPLVKPHYWSGLLGFTSVVLSSLLAFLSPLVNRYFIDDVIVAARADLLIWALFLFSGIKIFSIGVSFLKDYYLLSFQENVMQDLQASLLDHVLRLPKSFFDSKEIGYLISRISSDLQGLKWFFSGTLVYLLTNILQFFGGLAFLFYLEWRLALISVFLLPLLLLVVHYFSLRIRNLSQAWMEQHAQISKHLQETVASIQLVKAFASEDQESKRVMDAYQAHRQITMKRSILQSVANLAIQILPDLAIGVVLILGGYFVIEGQWTLGSLLAFIAYLGQVYGPAKYFADTNFSLQNSLVALQRVMDLLKIVPEENLEEGLRIDHLKGDLIFKDVSFSYGGLEPVLQNISFHIDSGEHVAILGPSGVGKTTLISLILAFYKPSQGEILFDGLPTSSYHLPSLRKRIGYVSQNTLLLSGTFNENLRYGNPNATQAEVEAAARAAGIHDFIDSLPNQYEALIGERAANLSEGQKQRLSIARALVKKPDIFILDEPTSALDSITEKSVFEALPSYFQNKTVFIIAHQLASIQAVDRILVFNDKQLLAMGTHEQLIAANPYYQKLVYNQMIKEA